MEKRKSIEATYTVRPSLVAKRIGYKGKLTTEGPAITLAENEHSTIVFDPEQGAIKIALSFDQMDEAVKELVEKLQSVKLPLLHENESLLSVKAWAFTSMDEVAIMESNGFAKEGSKEWLWNGNL
jgi:hypothetical protein